MSLRQRRVFGSRIAAATAAAGEQQDAGQAPPGAEVSPQRPGDEHCSEDDQSPRANASQAARERVRTSAAVTSATPIEPASHRRRGAPEGGEEKKGKPERGGVRDEIAVAERAARRAVHEKRSIRTPYV